MAIRPPALDDRSYDDLVAELIARIPAHTPEWTNPVPGDPGVSLLELFAWLADTILYRANLIPERQRLAFLRLLGMPLRPARPARGLIALSIDGDQIASAVTLQPPATVTGPAPFETLGEVTVLPVSAEPYYKRPLTDAEQLELAPVVEGLRSVYKLSGSPKPYVTTAVFANGVAEPAGFDLVARTVDKSLWLALLAPKKELKQEVRAALGGTATGARQLLSVGVVPAIRVPPLLQGIGPRAKLPHVWEVTALTPAGELRYLELDVVSDTSDRLTKPGVLRLALPAQDHDGKLQMAAPSNDVRTDLNAGVGDRPPRLDDPAKQERLVTWLRLRPAQRLQELSISWIGINAVDIDQRQTITARLVGQSDGSPNQEMQLPALSVDPDSLELQVEDLVLGYQTWAGVDDLALVGRDPMAGRTAMAYTLDGEAGTIRFGDGVLGRVPDATSRVRVSRMRAGGGTIGNLPPQSLRGISAPGLERTGIKLKVLQSVATEGGADAETLAQAEQRIPARVRDGDRAVTEADYRRLAFDTPGVRMGRVEVLPRFKPQQRRSDVPGVVTVMTLPSVDGFGPPAPRPDRPFLENVHRYLDERRPLSAELYTIGCEYVPVGVGVGVSIREGYGRDAVLQVVRDALQRYLWALPPGGIAGVGWPLGWSVRDRELEVAVARVAGVSGVSPVSLFRERDHAWEPMAPGERCGPVAIELEPWQLPELLSVVVVEGSQPPTDLRGAPNPFAAEAEGTVAVPVVPEVC